MPRGGLSGRPPFDPWDDKLYVQVLRGIFRERLSIELIHDGDGIPSALFDSKGMPFQAPDFGWTPDEVERGAQ
jgi:hypothetical protein